MKGKFLKVSLNKWKSIGSKDVPAACEDCCQWALWPSVREDNSIPRDVPKGHLVVYVGESHKRYVIKIALLKHPLFKALLDRAQDVYDFTTDSRLCIPCDENMFVDVVRCASSPKGSRICLGL